MVLSWVYFFFFLVLSLLVLSSVCHSSFGFTSEFLCFGSWWSDFGFSLLADDVNSVCLLMLFICGVLSLHYGFHYFHWSPLSKYLVGLMICFLVVMFFLIVSNNFLFSLICWEYLGLTSFFLIIFYCNGVSLRASLITLIISRFGDVSLFVVFGIFYVGCEVHPLLASLLYALIVGTKSAFYPVMGWLIEAMRAPTPVSALVHSSTLVAAGVWFLLRYGVFFEEVVFFVLSFCSLLSILASGVCALCESDLKKIIAFSTCNNISWCILFYLSGDVFLCVSQLLTHGVAKSQIFMLVGDLMSSGGSQQSVAGLYGGCQQGLYQYFVRSFLVFCLCGVPYLGVYFTKHGFFTLSSYCFDFFGFLFLFLGLTLSYSYSIRLFLILFNFHFGLSWGTLNNFVSVSLLTILSTGLNWYCVGETEECESLSFFNSAVVLFSELVGVFVGWFCYFMVPSGVLLWSSKLWGCSELIVSAYSLFLKLVVSVYCLFFRWEVWLISCLSVSSLQSLISRQGLFFNLSLVGLGAIMTVYVWCLLL